MPFRQVVPPRGTVDGTGRGLAFFISDLHLGNLRPTNEMLTTQPSYGRARDKLTALLMWLGQVGTTTAVSFGGVVLPEGQDPPQIDIVFAGDVFDFWKAVPEKLPHSDPAGWTSAGLLLWSAADYKARFAEILNYNRNLLALMAQLVGVESRSVRLIFLTGNHDDPMEWYGGALWVQMLTAAIAQHGPVPAGAIQVGNVYVNRDLRLLAEHGHRYDEQNCYRIEGQRRIPSLGQHLVESFLNGMHDFNLSNMGHRWERLVSAAPNPGGLRRFMRCLDNYREDLDGQEALRQLAQHSGISQQEMTLLMATSGAMAMMDGEVIGVPGQLSYDLQFVWTYLSQALFRKEGTGNDNHLWVGARRLIGKAFNMLPQLLSVDYATIVALPPGLFLGGQPAIPIQVVVMGHTHRPDAIPALSTGPTPDHQYVNTGTFVDMYHFQAANPLVPLSVQSDVLLMVDLVTEAGVTKVQINAQGGGIDGTRKIKRLNATFPSPP